MTDKTLPHTAAAFFRTGECRLSLFGVLGLILILVLVLILIPIFHDSCSFFVFAVAPRN